MIDKFNYYKFHSKEEWGEVNRFLLKEKDRIYSAITHINMIFYVFLLMGILIVSSILSLKLQILFQSRSMDNFVLLMPLIAYLFIFLLYFLIIWLIKNSLINSLNETMQLLIDAIKKTASETNIDISNIIILRERDEWKHL